MGLEVATKWEDSLNRTPNSNFVTSQYGVMPSVMSLIVKIAAMMVAQNASDIISSLEMISDVIFHFWDA